VSHTGAETVLSLANTGTGPLHVDGVELRLKCGISFTAASPTFEDADGSGHVNAGDWLMFSYVVRNVGSESVGWASLQNLTADVDEGPAIKCPAGVLRPRGELTCTGAHTLLQEEIDRRTVVSRASVTADDATELASHRVSASASATAEIPWLKIVKTATVDDAVKPPSGRVDVGDKVTYSYAVTNPYDASLSGLSVSDPDAGEVTCPKPTLEAKATMKCTAEVVLSQPQIDSGELSSTATVRASTSGGTSVSAAHVVKTRLAGVGSLTLDKRVAARAAVKAGDKVSYLFAAANEGNVTLSGLSVSDPKTGKVTCPETTLAPMASTTCTAAYTATPTDIAAGVIKNTATATASTPKKTKVSAADSVSFTFGGVVVPPRLEGEDRYETAAVISKETFDPGVDAVYVATGVNFPDALAGSAASGGDGPILLVTKDAIGGAMLTELKRLKPKRIIVLGGTGVVSAAVESALKKQATTTRQAGADRYSTAAAISAEHFDSGADVAYVATGADFPDALTGGPAAAKLGGPILLTQKDVIPAATVTELKRLKPKKIVVLGGTGVVSPAVEKALAAHTAGKVSRLAGADRYSTGAAISKDAFDPGVGVVYVATGLNFPDALAGGAAGAFRDGPVLLVAGAKIPPATAAELTRLKPKNIIVLGGAAVVPKTVETALGRYIR